MKAFIFKILLFATVIFLVDFFAGIVLDKLYKNAQSGVALQENYIFNETKEDVLIFGSSRAAFHYIPGIISKETGYSVYNVGREGTGIYFHNVLLLATLDRYKPKVVVLDLDFRDIYNRTGNFSTDVYKELLPYYGKFNIELDSIITPNFYDAIFCQSNLYKYNKKFFNVISGSFPKAKDNFNGYRPLIGEWDKTPKKLPPEKLVVGDKLLQTIGEFINRAKQNDIKIIIALSPSYKQLPQEFYDYTNKLSNTYQVEVLNHYKDSTFLNNSAYFYDEEHLNNKGAELYSKKISKEINAILNNIK